MTLPEEEAPREKPLLPADVVAKLKQHQAQHVAPLSTHVKSSQHDDAEEGSDDSSCDEESERESSASSRSIERPAREGANLSASQDLEVSSPLSLEGDYLNFLPKQQKSSHPALVGTVSGETPRSSLGGASDLGGRPVAVSPTESPVPREVPLWAVKRYETGGGYSANALVALHQEITDMVDFLRPTKGEITMRRLVEVQIAKIAKRLWPECEPCVYGSMSTHLLLPISDLDMSILNVPCSAEEGLLRLSREIGNAQLCTNTYPQVILKTRVPILKFTHRTASVEVDCSINAADGKTNTEIVCKLLQEYPEAEPLTILVKYFLKQRDMHEPYRGGMGSFATTLLVISFLQHHPIYTTDARHRRYYGLGKLFVDFFKFYGQCFNYHRVGISLARGGFFFLKPPSPPNDPLTGRAPPQVLLEDPGNPSNNAASSLRYFQTIVSSFDHAFLALTAELDPPENPMAVSPSSPLVSHRPTLLSRIFHIDPFMMEKRASMEEAYQRFLATEPEDFVEYVHSFKKDADRQFLDTVWKRSLRPKLRADNKEGEPDRERKPRKRYRAPEPALGGEERLDAGEDRMEGKVRHQHRHREFDEQ